MTNRLGVAAGCAVLLWTGCSLSGEYRAQELGCARHTNPRTVQICRAIAEELEFELMGHAILAPGYKATVQTSVRVYCKLGLTQRDVPALKPLLHTNYQVNSATEDLLGMLGAVPVSDVSVFNPQHSKYVLKDGCPAR